MTRSQLIATRNYLCDRDSELYQVRVNSKDSIYRREIQEMRTTNRAIVDKIDILLAKMLI